jgi:hypothetical protein
LVSGTADLGPTELGNIAGRDESADPEQLRLRMLDSLATFLTNAVDRGPLLV